MKSQCREEYYHDAEKPRGSSHYVIMLRYGDATEMFIHFFLTLCTHYNSNYLFLLYPDPLPLKSSN